MLGQDGTLLIPVPVEKLLLRCESGLARPVEVAVEEQGQVLRNPQEIQPTWSKRGGIEAAVHQNLRDLLSGEPGDDDPPLGLREQPPQPLVIPPVEFPAHDDGVNRSRRLRPFAGLPQEALNESEFVGVSARHDAHGVQLIDDQNGWSIDVLGRRRQHQDRRFLEAEVLPKLVRQRREAGGSDRAGMPAQVHPFFRSSSTACTTHPVLPEPACPVTTVSVAGPSSRERTSCVAALSISLRWINLLRGSVR